MVFARKWDKRGGVGRVLLSQVNYLSTCPTCPLKKHTYTRARKTHDLSPDRVCFLFLLWPGFFKWASGTSRNWLSNTYKSLDFTRPTFCPTNSTSLESGTETVRSEVIS